ncbi:ROK family protein [Pectobacterium cacticida]|uniref:ROK family protein n=1 Tax=Pectobacterium cacticida TaxID=69221 RepID=A0ABZ2GE66_9GAMM|nr:ROK family protein [Pectobacterium cacticida]UYX05622.1 ROK family protein [Pectobacterium cacticida]
MNTGNEPALTEVAQAVFACLLGLGEATRKQLAEGTGFSFPSVTVALAELAASNYVCELRREQGARGRATIVYGVSEDAGWVLGVDIGSTQISYVGRALNGKCVGSGSIKRNNSLEHPGALAGGLLARAAALVALDAAPLAVTVAVNKEVPRQLSHPHRPRSPALDIAETFVASCGLPSNTPFILENNVNCATVAEFQQGLMRGHDDAAYMQIGVGIGLGFFADGMLIRGGHGYSGELAQIPISWSHARVSDPDAIEQRYGSSGLMERAAECFLKNDTSPPASPEALFALGATGHALAQALMLEHSVALGRIAATAATILDPSIFVLGGGLSRNPVFAQMIADEFTKRNKETRIEISQMGSDATVEGACFLARDFAMVQLVSRYHRAICARPTLLPG